MARVKPLVVTGVLLLAAAGTLLNSSCGNARPVPPAAAPDPARPFPPRRFAERLTLAGVENVGLVAPGLYRGAQPSEEGLCALKALGVRTVVNLRHFHSDEEEKACRRLGLAYRRFSTESSDAPTDEAVCAFLKTVTDPSLRPLFFHCAHGKDRTGTMAACYRMAAEGWTLDEALAEMDAFGFRMLWKDLRAYVKAFAPRAADFRPAGS